MEPQAEENVQAVEESLFMVLPSEVSTHRVKINNNDATNFVWVFLYQ